MGGWVRPVSNRPTQEIAVEERRYENGEDPKLLDVISIRMQGHVPHAHQTENHLIDAGYYWVKEGTVTWGDLDAAVEDFQGALWVDGYHSYNGENDRIPEAQTLELGHSLTLVETENLVILRSGSSSTYVSIMFLSWRALRKRMIFDFSPKQYVALNMYICPYWLLLRQF